MTEPNTQWTAIEPGVMVLPTTKYQIRYERFLNIRLFTVYWNEEKVGDRVSLEDAKALAAEHMTSMIEMGYEV